MLSLDILKGQKVDVFQSFGALSFLIEADLTSNARPFDVKDPIN